MTFVQGLLRRQFEQSFLADCLVINFVNPKLTALARVPGDRFAVLAGDGYFHFLPRYDRSIEEAKNASTGELECAGRQKSVTSITERKCGA